MKILTHINRLILISTVMVGVLLTTALPVRAVDYTWTNTADQSSGYWTNGVLWGNLIGNYPGSVANTPNTYLTNNVSVAGGSYTTILNLTPAAALTSLVISNGNGGEAWLIVTNNPAGTGVTLTTPLVLGSGGRLQIDNKGTVNIGSSAFNWLGTNGAIWLNNGGNLVTTGARTIGAGGSVTGLVTSASGAGNGGVWNFSAGTGALTIGGASGHDNLIRVTDGAALSNIVTLTMSGNRNSLLVTNGGQLHGTGVITVGGAAGQYGNTLTMEDGFWNVGGNIYVGANAAGSVVGSSNNAFNIVGGTVSNVTSLFVGVQAVANSGAGASGNSFVVTNGGRLYLSGGGLGIGGFSTFVGGGNNTVILSNSVLGVGGASMVGRGSSNNTLTVLQDTLVDHRNTLMQIGFDAAVGNVVTVNGAIVTNISNLTVGSGAGNVNFDNSVIVTNGGQLRVTSNVIIGTGGSRNNTLIIDGGPQALASSTVFSNGNTFTIGTVGSGYNSVTVTNAILATGEATIGNSTSNNTVTVLADATWNMRGFNLRVGLGATTGNVVTVNSGILTNVAGITLGGTNNSLAVHNGGQLFGAGVISFNTAGYGNTFTMGDGVWNHIAQSLTVGGGANSSNNAFSLSGGLVTNISVLSVGSAVGADFNSVIVTGGSLRMIVDGSAARHVFVGASSTGGGGSYNTVTVSNSLLSSAQNLISYVGWDSSSNRLTLIDSTWRMQRSVDALIIGNGAATGNVVTLDSSIITNYAGDTPNFVVGSGANSVGNALIVTNASRLFIGTPGIIVGRSGSVSNLFKIDGGASSGAFVTNSISGSMLITIGAAGSGYNSLLVTNARLFTSGAITIGSGSSNNTATILGDVTWNFGLNTLTIGTGAATGNVLTVNGSTVTNIGTGGLQVGATAGANFNSLLVTNGGRLFQNAGAFVVGSAAGGGVGGGGNTVILTNSALTTGHSFIGSGSSNNTVTLFNTVWNQSLLSLTVGTGAATGNVLIVNGSIITNIGDAGLRVGITAGAHGNSLIATNGSRLFMNAGAVLVGSAAGGGVGGGGNTLALSNSVLQATTGGGGASFIGAGSSNNTMTLLDSVWNQNTANLTVGGNNNAGVGNVLTVNNALLTNVNSLTVGSGAGNVNYGNSLIVANGGQLRINTTVTIGANGSSNNTLIIDGGSQALASSTVFSNVGNFIVGNVANSHNNSVTVTNARLFTGEATIGWTTTNNTVAILTDATWNVRGFNLRVGLNAAAVGNELIVNGGIVSNVLNMQVGTTSSTGNSLLITNGGEVFVTTSVRVSEGAGSVGNRVLVTDGGLLEANTLTISLTGNTISNRNATYQFTAAPAITPVTPGNIALTDGTISFRATGAANVTNTPANQIRNILFAGANTFTLNNASNTAAGAGISQTYTFDAISVNPSNYARLVMVNGPTAYGHASGANITIGLNGSMLVSNTTALISGLVTNTGSLSVVNAYATFQSRVYNSGTNTMLNSIGTFNSGVINAGSWITDPTTNIFANFGLTNTISGAISMAAGDVYVFTNTVGGTPANFINVSTNNTASDTTAGKFLFSGGLGLTQTFAVAGHDLGPGQLTPLLTATNLALNSGSTVAGFANNFALGTLEISNFSTVRVTDAFLDLTTAGLYLENLFLGENSLLIIEEGVQVYFKNSNDWSLANIWLVNNQGALGDDHNYNNTISGLHQIVVIPEPSVLLLCMAGFVTLWVSRRRRRLG